MKSPVRICFDAKGALVPHDHPSADSLAVGAGVEVPKKLEAPVAAFLAKQAKPEVPADPPTPPPPEESAPPIERETRVVKGAPAKR